MGPRTVLIMASLLLLGGCAGSKGAAAPDSPAVGSATSTPDAQSEIAATTAAREETNAPAGALEDEKDGDGTREVAGDSSAYLGGAVERKPAAPLATPPPPAEAKKERARSRAAMGMDKDDSGAASSSVSTGAPAPAAPVVTAPAMRAGRHDDNKEYNRFLSFLDENRALLPYPVDIGERLVLRAVDRDGKSIPNCTVEVKSLKGTSLSTTVTYADGRTQFFPTAAATAADKDFTVAAKCKGVSRNSQLSRSGRRELEVRFDTARVVPHPVPVDIAVVLDVTGSMQSQIDRLKNTLKAIHFQLTSLSTKPNIRFGLVAYRDRGDDFVTRVTDFTGDVGAFQRVLDKLEADGGGDTPEDLQKAVEDAMHSLTWRADALRLGFIVADAPPHTDYGQSYNYREAMREALARGVKWTSVGAGGLGRDGEVVFRQIAQFSMGEYVFVTEGEGGDSEGGAGEASHHVGSNYRTENLDQAIIRIVRRELSYLTDAPKDFDDTIVATADAGVPRDTVLAPAVAEILRQLADYSSLKLAPHTPVAVVPVTAAGGGHKDVAEYLTDQMILSASRNPSFRVVERDLTAVAQEVKLQLNDLFDVTETVPIGRMVGAELLIASKLTVTSAGASLYAKLIRVETGEMLSVANVDIAASVLKGS